METRMPYVSVRPSNLPKSWSSISPSRFLEVNPSAAFLVRSSDLSDVNRALFAELHAPLHIEDSMNQRATKLLKRLGAVGDSNT
jgi:hypothetical protein